MKEKLLSFVNGSLCKLWLMFVMVLASASVSAQETVWKQLQLNTPLDMNVNRGYSDAKYQFTPEEDGVVTIFSQDAIVYVCTEKDAEGTNVNFDTQIQQYAGWVSETIDGFTFQQKVTATLKKDVTYYITTGTAWSADKKFYATMQTGVTELKIVSNNQPDKMYSIADDRDGQLVLEFNLPAKSEKFASIQLGAHKCDTIEVHSDVNTGKLVMRFKEVLFDWMDKGYFTVGDPFTITVKGIVAQSDENIKYGTDGTLVLYYTAPGKPHYHLSTTGMDTFYSYWVEGNSDGIVTLEFDYDLMKKEDGQTAQAIMVIGSADAGDAYSEVLDDSKITVDGKKMYIDFTGKRRSYADMGLQTKWGTMDITVSKILMADGTNSFSNTKGNYGKVTLSRPFTELKSDIMAEFTPADGSQLTENQFKVYFSDKNALKFGGVRVSYQTLDDIKYQIDIREGITSEEQGRDGIEYTIPLPAEVVAGKNIRISFLDQETIDGFEHEFNVRYNPGQELVDDFLPTSVSVEDGAILTSLDNIVLTFDEDVNIHTLGENMEAVSVTDLTTNTPVGATITSDGKTATITPASQLKDTHKYSFYINHEVIVNKEYVETDGKYGRYMPGKTIEVTLFKDFGNYDIMIDPLPGSTVNELRVITCTQKPGTDASAYAVSPTRLEDRIAYVEDAAGNKITECTLGDDLQNGFTLTLNEAITKSGEYTLVMPDSLYNRGEGYTVYANDDPVRVKYTVIAAPQAEITVDVSDPSNESNVESISEIMLMFSEEVYGEDADIYVYNPTQFGMYKAKLTINKKNRKMALVTLDEPITEDGNYQVVIPQGTVGDQIWYESGCMTGKVNADYTLYLSIGQGSGGDDEAWTTDPANNSTVTSLHEIHIWNTTTPSMGIGSGKIVIKKDGVELEKVDADYGTDWNECIVTTSTEYTEAGVYTVEVPEGYFLDEPGNALPAVTFTYTIGGGGDVSSDWTSDPADKSTVTSLHEIHIWNTTTPSMGIGSGKIVIKKDGVELEKVDADYGTDWNECIVTTSTEYTEAGVYTVEVPEGYFLDEPGNALPAVTFTYTIEGISSGIGSVEADADGKLDVFTVGGKIVKMNATKNDIKSLRGIYIINGKKTVLK